MSLSLENVQALLEHARQAPEDEARVALDLASAAIRRGRMETLAALVEARADEVRALQKVRGLTAYAVGSGQGSPTIARLHTLLKQMPDFEAENGIRAALPAFEFTEKHSDEIQNLLKAI